MKKKIHAQKTVVVFFAKIIKLFADMMLKAENDYVMFCTGLFQVPGPGKKFIKCLSQSLRFEALMPV